MGLQDNGSLGRLLTAELYWGRMEAMPTVQQDLSCSRCGYNLRSLRTDGRCPECGRGIRQSFSHAAGEPARRARQASVLAVASALMLVSVVAVILGPGTPGGAIRLAVGLVGWAAGSVALWVAAARPSGVSESPVLRVWRYAMRACGVVLGLYLAALLVRPEPTDIRGTLHMLGRYPCGWVKPVTLAVPCLFYPRLAVHLWSFRRRAAALLCVLTPAVILLWMSVGPDWYRQPCHLSSFEISYGRFAVPGVCLPWSEWARSRLPKTMLPFMRPRVYTPSAMRRRVLIGSVAGRIGTVVPPVALAAAAVSFLRVRRRC